MRFKTKEQVITKCKSCKTENLVKQKCQVISDENVDEFVEVEALVCMNCGTIHDPEGNWHQVKVKNSGYTKTSVLKADNVNEWN